ncbi:glycosyltransferase [Pontibacter liquoris]|uniref:glycosyltransferase n=1 Tax=Pontibacter liquoris TaxID=2905677 RepID=UPI001FA73C11|nr:glycosyltransferase [Pontibacter liquoris]
MKKVCFLLTSLEPGGLENYLLRFLKYSDGKFTPIVICKSGRAGKLLPHYQSLNVNIVTIKTGYLNLLSWYKIFKFLREEGVDTVCDFTGNFAGIYLLISKYAGIKKRIAFYRQSTNHFKENAFTLKYNSFVQKLVYKNATQILANSNVALNYFFPDRSSDDNRFQVIYNGVDQSQFNISIERSVDRLKFGIPVDAFVIGHTGRFDAVKNHISILEVARFLCAKHADIYFVFCGRGTDSKAMVDLVNEMGLLHRVKLLGYREDVNRVLKAFDVFYFPSLTEGQPNSLIEAMISGVPFIASNIEPIRETVPDYLLSQLIEPKDTEAATKKILELYHNRSSLPELKASEWAKRNFDHDTRFKEFLDNL